MYIKVCVSVDGEIIHVLSYIAIFDSPIHFKIVYGDKRKNIKVSRLHVFISYFTIALYMYTAAF